MFESLGIPHRIAALALVILTVACGAAPAADEQDAEALRGLILPEPPPPPAFVLTDTDGAPYSFRERVAGKLGLLFIGYTHCPDVCPVHMANLAAVLRDLPQSARRRVEVVFVTADPARDTAQRIREWLDAFDPSFVGLRGSVEEVNGILAELSLPGIVHGEPDADGGYAVGHPAHMIAFPPDGGPARAYYGFGTRQADWRHDLPLLLQDTLETGTPASATAPIKRARDRAVVPEPAADGAAAVYLVLRNPRREPDALVGASSAVAEAVTLHGYASSAGGEHGAADHGMSMMRAVEAIEIAPRDSVRLAPGGYHLMLEGLRHRPTVGDTFTIDLSFRSGRRVAVEALVLPYETVEAVLRAEGGER